MPHSSDIDAELMDFLYGELSEVEEDRFRERLAEDPELSAEVEAFQATRKAFKALPVEEPPPAVSAQLLHEAARRAPARKRAHTVEERPGFWAAVVEFFRPLVRHPAAASMAALLLVAGVAGALYLRGVDSPAHPTAASEAPAPGTATAAGTPTDLPGLDGKDDDARNGAFARIDGLKADDPTGDVTLKTQPSAGFLPDGSEDGEDNTQFRARLAEPEQEKALEESKGESQRWSMNKRLEDGRRAGGGTKLGGEPLANAVSGADPLIVPEETPSPDPAKPSIKADKAKDTGSEVAATRGVRDATTKGGMLGGKKGKREREQTELEREEKSVARQAPLRKSKEIAAPAKKPAPRSRSFEDSDGDDFGVADEEADVAPQMAQSAQPPPQAGATSEGARGKYRVYKNRKDDQWAKSAHGKLNLALDSKSTKSTKKSKKKRCRRAAKIANDILDRNPAYYTSKVENSKWLKPCSGFVASERSRRVKNRSKVGPGTGGKANAAKKKSRKASGSSPGKAKAAPADEMDAAESAD